MLALVRRGLPRQRAYEMVQRSALAARDEGGTFRELLAADERGRRASPRARARRLLRSRAPPAPRRRDHRARASDAATLRRLLAG